MNIRALLYSLVCFAAVGFALYSQHVWDMQPCPWCIAQRIVFILAGLIALIASFAHAKVRLIMLLPAVLCGFGVGMAGYQHWVAKYQSSCSYSNAEKFVRWTGLDELVPWAFDITATCADAAKANLAGIPYEVASGLLLLFLSIGALFLFKQGRRAR
jgi:protein dithiol:quinone oxidoreductase